MTLLFWDGLDSYASTDQLQQRPGISLIGPTGEEITHGPTQLIRGGGRWGQNAVGSTGGFMSGGAVFFTNGTGDTWTGRAVKAPSAAGIASTTIFNEGVPYFPVCSIASENSLNYGYAPIIGSNGDIWWFTRGYELTLLVNRIGNFILVNNVGQILTQTTGMQFRFNVWNYVELRASFDTGVFEIWCNNMNVASGVGVCNPRGGTTAVAINLSSGPSSCLADDIYVLSVAGTYNNQRMGDCRMFTCTPNEDTQYNNGTPYTGTNHWPMVDDYPGWDANTYIVIPNTSGAAEIFGHTHMPNSASIIRAVAVNSAASKTDAGPMFFRNTILLSGASHYGNTHPLTTTTTVWRDDWEVNPNGNSPWSNNAVNECLIGVSIN